ncbi:MAG TPA: ribosome biogenesis GTPase Der [Candidatus Mcinerneyibacterium sp.]|nr:ribosome biogenesis GTPase Der [Candidatus Mcinerneyibacterium sp.]
MNKIPYVTIIGRTNVGKSTLFNRLIKENKAIVDDRPGVTRDRLYGHVIWDEVQFGLIDTAGLTLEEEDDFAENLYKNVEIGIEEGDLILFVLDGKKGLAQYDYRIAEKLRKRDKPVIVVKNKSEKKKDAENYYDLYELGFEHIAPVSAKYNHGIYDLLDLIIKNLPFSVGKSDKKEEDTIKLAITGKPNVGKSTLLNSFLNRYRSVVDDKWGTTRDTIDEEFQRNNQKYILIDTAGIRRKNKIKGKLERYMVMRALKAIDRADVIIHLIDGVDGFTTQDDKILGYAHERGTGIIIAVNKWDIVEKDEKTYMEYVREIRTRAKFLEYASIYFISAKNKRNLFKLIDIAEEIYEVNTYEINNKEFYEFIKMITNEKTHPIKKNKVIKFKFAKQVDIRPPTFVIFSNYPDLIHFAYKRYIKNSIRREYGFWGSAIKLIFKKS